MLSDMPNIVDGKLLECSPSMLNAFDQSTRFGCERRGRFKYIDGLPEPQSGNAALGESLHELIEHRLRTGNDPEGESEAHGIYLAGKHMIEEVAARKILGVEIALDPFYIEGVKVKGYIDVLHENGIVDWKTTSDIRRYGKTAEQLAWDTQMVLYGLSTDLPRVQLAHGQFQTRGAKRTEFVEVEVTRDHLDSHLEKVIIPLVERIKFIAGDPESARPDFTKCFNCPFRAKCPTVSGDQIVSFFAKYNQATTTATPPPAQAQPILPPDAPKSDPALAAEPPKTKEKERLLVVKEEPKPEPEPVVEEPKAEESPVPPPKRGRPKGSKNKPKESEGAASTPSPSGFTVTKVSVTRGFTLNLGNFNSARMDITLEAEGEDFEATYAALYAEIQKRLDAEGAKLATLMEKDAKK